MRGPITSSGRCAGRRAWARCERAHPPRPGSGRLRKARGAVAVALGGGAVAAPRSDEKPVIVRACRVTVGVDSSWWDSDQEGRVWVVGEERVVRVWGAGGWEGV